MPDKEMMVKSITGGWLLVRLDAGSEVSLPEFCHVRLHTSANGRDIITIQEGPHKNKAASVKTGFLDDRRHDTKAVVTFFLRSHVLTWQGGPAVKTLSTGAVSGGMLHRPHAVRAPATEVGARSEAACAVGNLRP